MISLDSVRRDLLGCYGHSPLHARGKSPSPALDRLAIQGVRLTEAYAAAPWTLPSHVSMFTGQSPLVHAVETDMQVIDESEPVLAEVLRDHGYRTIGLFSGPYLDPHFGFARGFDRWDAFYSEDVAELEQRVDQLRADIARLDEQGEHARAHELRWGARAALEEVRWGSHRDVSGGPVTDAALAALDGLAAGGEPWFLFAHYFDPHYDYIPPPPWDGAFDPDYRGAMTGESFLTNPALSIPDSDRPGLRIRTAGARDFEHVLALYEGELAWTDSLVGRILERLDQLGVARRTLVIVLSDHGDEFFEHGGLGHRRTLYEEAIQVPMLLRLPGVLPAGSAVSGLVSTADLMPTILDLVGIAPPVDLDGESAVPLIRGTQRPDARTLFSRLVFFEVGAATVDGITIPRRQVTIDEVFRQGSVKIVRARSWPLFPLDAPARIAPALARFADEQFQREDLLWVDVAANPAEEPGTFSSRFDGARPHAVLDKYRSRYGRSVALRRQAVDTSIDQVLRSRLIALGYLDSAQDPLLPATHDFVLPLPGDIVSTTSY